MIAICAHPLCTLDAGGYEGRRPDLCYAHSKIALGLMRGYTPHEAKRSGNAPPRSHNPDPGLRSVQMPGRHDGARHA